MYSNKFKDLPVTSISQWTQFDPFASEPAPMQMLFLVRLGCIRMLSPEASWQLKLGVQFYFVGL